MVVTESETSGLERFASSWREPERMRTHRAAGVPADRELV